MKNYFFSISNDRYTLINNFSSISSFPIDNSSSRTIQIQSTWDTCFGGSQSLKMICLNSLTLSVAAGWFETYSQSNDSQLHFFIEFLFIVKHNNGNNVTSNISFAVFWISIYYYLNKWLKIIVIEIHLVFSMNFSLLLNASQLHCNCFEH